MSDGSAHRLSRGDRRRNNKLGRLRSIITRQTAVLAFDLGSYERARRVAEGVRMITHAVSLGGVYSLIQHPAALSTPA